MPSNFIDRVKSVARYLRALAIFATGALWIVKRRVEARGEVVVLTFHRVLDDEEFGRSSSLRGMRVRARTFEAFASWASRTFEVVRPDSVNSTGTPSERARIALTFDDGWLDTYVHARPIAAKFHIPLTVFVCTGLDGRRVPFWPERVCRSLRRRSEAPYSAASRGSRHFEIEEAIVERLKRLPSTQRDTEIAVMDVPPPQEEGCDSEEPLNALMTWDQIRLMHAGGAAIGSHTITHAILTGVPQEVAYREMADSRTDIERSLGSECRTLAYPNGNVTADLRNMAERAGYRLGFVTRRGRWTRNTDPLQIPRINVWEHKLVGPRGRFSRVMAMYSLLWRTGG